MKEDIYWQKLKTEVIDAGLCTYCGSCVGLSKELKFPENGEPLPQKVGSGNITEKCYTACPGKSIDYPKLNTFLFNKHPKNWIIGNYKKIFIGYTLDEKIRRNSSSGGILTQAVLYLLEKKKIQGAVVLNPDTTTPYKSVPIIAKTRKQILDASQSVYIVTPLNTILSDMQKFNGKLAYVGLPDQVASIRKLQHYGELQNKVEYVFGLYMSMNMYRGAIESYLRSHGVKSLKEVKELKYREGEWPGYLKITLTSGKILKTKKFYYNYLLPFYITNSSLYQCDFTNELTDISVGDAWSPKYEKIGKGFSVIIARTKKGIELLREMQHNNKIHLKEISEKEAMDMHGHMFDFKKRGSFIRLNWRYLFGQGEKPFYGYEPVDISVIRKAVELFSYALFTICRTKIMRRTIEYIPINLMGYLFNVIRKTWKYICKPTKRRGFYNQKFRILTEKK